MICEYCGNTHDGKFATGRFCNRSCSNKFSRLKIKENFLIERKCIGCGCLFMTSQHRGPTNSKCDACKKGTRKTSKNGIEYYSYNIATKCTICGGEKLHKKKICENCRDRYYKYYRKSCEFTFNILDYVMLIDSSISNDIGWYSPTNKRNNLVGASKDHMFSVYNGFVLNIDSYIIKHPANCEIILFSNNSSKGKRNKINLIFLLKRILEFESKIRSISDFEISNIKNLILNLTDAA